MSRTQTPFTLPDYVGRVEGEDLLPDEILEAIADEVDDADGPGLCPTAVDYSDEVTDDDCGGPAKCPPGPVYPPDPNILDD